MEKSWFKYGNFDTRDYPNLLIELLPNQNIPEKNAEQTNVFGQNGSILYPGGVKNTTRTYHIALISDEDDSINRFGSLARFIDWQLRSQIVNSELIDSYLVFPDEELPQATLEGSPWTYPKYPDMVHDKKTYYLASYLSSETISNIYNITARVSVAFTVSPIYWSFKLRSYPSSSTQHLMKVVFNDDGTFNIPGDTVAHPFVFFVGNKDRSTNGQYYQPLDNFWERNTELKLHAKALTAGYFGMNIYYQAVYYDNYPSGININDIGESRVNMGLPYSYNEGDEITIDLKSGKVSDKYDDSNLQYARPSEYIGVPISIRSLDDGRRSFVTSAHTGSSDHATAYNGWLVFYPESNWSFSLEVIKHG